MATISGETGGQILDLNLVSGYRGFRAVGITDPGGYVQLAATDKADKETAGEAVQADGNGAFNCAVGGLALAETSYDVSIKFGPQSDKLSAFRLGEAKTRDVLSVLSEPGAGASFLQNCVALGVDVAKLRAAAEATITGVVAVKKAEAEAQAEKQIEEIDRSGVLAARAVQAEPIGEL